jgi:uroporphyrinogen-III synthase
MRVWITRTRPGADQTAARLAALGIDSLIDPVLEVRALDVRVETSGFDALAFTSPNGVAVFAAKSADRGLPVFAVGEATAMALRQAGFSGVEAAEGDLTSLARLLTERRPGRILALGPTEPAGDLAAMTAGAAVEVLSIYETTARRPADALAAGDLAAVMVHSVKGARAVAMAGRGLRTLHVLALSEACAAPLRDLPVKSIAAAPFPDDASLARLAADILSDAHS